MGLIEYNNGDRNDNKIALTFDDGPNALWTPRILDVLAQYSVKANFFILGKWAEISKSTVEATFARGHLIGNHTYSHPQNGMGDFGKAEVIIYNIIGENTKFIRPPYNNVNLCNSYEPAVSGKVKIINNDVIPGDWILPAEVILNNVIQQTKNGSIILLHDGSEIESELQTRPAAMFDVLSKIIQTLKEKFEFVRLDDPRFRL